MALVVWNTYLDGPSLYVRRLFTQALERPHGGESDEEEFTSALSYLCFPSPDNKNLIIESLEDSSPTILLLLGEILCNHWLAEPTQLLEL